MNGHAVFRGARTVRFSGAAVALVGAMGPAATALAADDGDSAGACIDAYEEAQERRLSGALLEAREGFARCSREACPAFIHADCSRFSADLDSEIPSVLFEMTSGDRQLSEVRVFEGARFLGHASMESALELDPGSHTLRFEAPEAEPVTRAVAVERGERNLLVTVELPSRVPSLPPPEHKAQAPLPTQVDERRSAAPWVALGLGAAGISGFVILGAAGWSAERRLERTCAPRCRERDLESVRARYALADVSLAVGVSGVVIGGYLLLTREPARGASERAWPVVVEVGPGRGAATVRGSF